MSIKKHINKEATHSELGRVTIISVPPKSRTRLNIRVLQRGKGWDEPSQTYRPVKRVRLNPDAGPGAKSIFWDLCRRDQYNHEDEVHIDELTF